MAITITSTDELSESQKPTSAHTPGTVTALTGNKLVARYSTEIASSGNVNANAETAYGLIEDDLETWITGTLLVNLKLDVAQSVTAVNYVESLTVKSSDKFSSADRTYVLTGRVEVQ